jgi:hypothetical protein
MAIDERNARVQIASEQDVDRKIVASRRAGDPAEAWFIQRAVRLLGRHNAARIAADFPSAYTELCVRGRILKVTTTAGQALSNQNVSNRTTS